MNSTQAQQIAVSLSRAAFGVALVLVLASVMPTEPARMHAPDLLGAAAVAQPADSATLATLPDAMIEATLSAELAVGRAYWSAVITYVTTTRAALDAAAALYNQSIQNFVDSTHAVRDLSAAAYGGIAEGIVGGITAVHDSQVRSMQSMSASMADGMIEASALYEGIAQWYAQSDSRIHQRLERSAP